MDPDQTNKFPVADPDTARSANADSGPNPEVGWSLDKGVTRENNEDSLAAVTLNQASDVASQAIGVYVVADGIGGEQGGEIASQLSVHTVVRRLMADVAEANTDMPEHYRQWLERAVTLANRLVREKGQAENINMGTTLVMAVVVGHDVHVANVGDSRAYLISPSAIRQITHDQTVAQALVDN